MSKVYLPAKSALDWKPWLAQPDKHWKAGYSAMSVAQCWQAADGRLPPEIAAVIATGKHPLLQSAELLLAIPEYQVDLPHGSRPTQTDVFALLRGGGGLVACAIEGKVDEAFGPLISEKRREGAADRLKYLHELLEITESSSGPLRYQLFHRTVAAVLLAQRFHAHVAVMLVHSFSGDHRWYSDFESFARALGVEVERGALAHVGRRDGVELYLGWAQGDPRFTVDLTS